MKKTQKNYKEFDYQTIVIKEENADEILENYKCFGWIILNTKQSSHYSNILEVELIRNHFIENKDTLQFLQVNMESDINKKARLEKNKHSNSIFLGIFLGLICTGAIACGILSFLNLLFGHPIVWGCIFCSLALIIAIILPILVVKVVKKENFRFKKEIVVYIESINSYCNKALKLIGVTNEQE